MSLTHPFGIKQKAIVDAIKQITPKKEEFTSLSGGPCFNKKQPCLMPYNLSSKYLAMRSGVAFDYLARFLIAQKVKDYKDDALSGLVAERMFTMSSSRWFGYETERAEGLNWYRGILEEVSEAIAEDSVFSQRILDICVLLGKIEQEKRGGRTQNPKFELTAEDVEVVQDLKLLADVFVEKFLPLVEENGVIVFNPTFGIGSRMVGGADADVYIDGVIYDFKVHKESKWRIADARQLMGYYILDSIAKDAEDSSNKLKKNQVNRVAIYSARYGEVFFYDFGKCALDKIQEVKAEIRYQYLKCGLWWIDKKTIKRLRIPLTEEELGYCEERL
ncbi:MAG: hypothetical protein IKU62_09025, partial [Ruminiclostridium sp.]|nr:hypothetical protein [Ruminiclostridium sp.]